jgi:polyisoprenoid-binding protein YceI|tara:strand:- start:445 stop:1038 length:594 start_codon:yes stop_codon:yes gene_type:complete
MLKNLFVKILALSFIFQFSFTLHTNDVKVNKKNSTVIWTGSKPTGSHTGNMNIKSGYLTYDHGQVVGGNFVIDMKSITCSDIKSEKKNQYLVDHLKDADFFNVAKFPEASLTIIRVQKLKENQFQMLADLTIKGITKPVSFTADLSVNGNSYNAIAKIIIDRTKWGVEYKSGNIFKDLGDKIIYDDIEFDIFLVSEK